ncbi:MAG: HEAT repeat domain-containing protein [Euryarchaeota archaeon]|jgi:HEAT repeat protein|nr:HEAT repeat domain-containing protein [Euryarchaeota archaeon]
MGSSIDENQYASQGNIEYLISALNDKDYSIRKRAAKALGGSDDERAVLGLIDSLKYHEWFTNHKVINSVRVYSAESLGVIGDPRAIMPLMESLEEDPIAEVREKAAWALGRFDTIESIDALTCALYDEEWMVRKSAANSLGTLQAIDKIPYLYELFDDENELVRNEALIALGKMGESKAIEILLNYLSDQDRDVNLRSLAAFEEIGTPAVEPLKKALKSGDWQVRLRAVEALEQIGGETVQKELISLIHGFFSKDNNYLVRAKAAEVLGVIGDEKALKPLRKACDDNHEIVRYNAKQAIREIIKNINKYEIWNFDNGEISFNFTRNWEMISTADPKKVVKGQYDNNTITFSITRNEDVFDISVKEFSQMLKHVFDIQNTALIKEKEFTKDDMDCYLLLGENQKVYPTKIIIISFKKYDLLFYLWFAGDPFALENSKDEISLIVNSFKISG